MKVKYSGESSVSLTHGMTYNVVGIESNWFRIVDNTGEDYLFCPEEFEIQKIREEAGGGTKLKDVKL